MKVSPLKGFGNMGASVTELAYPFEQSEIEELKKLLLKELVVVLPKINYTAEQYYELTGKLGKISTFGLQEGIDEPEGWTGYLDDNGKTILPGLWKVTAKKTKDGRFAGMPTGISKRLNWHNNETDGINPAANFVALQGVKGTAGSITQVCQMIDRFEKEPNENKELLRKINVLWGVVPGDDGIMPDLPKPGEEGYDAIQGTEEMTTKEDMDKYKDAINMNIKQQPLIQVAPNGKEGLRFTPSQVVDISPHEADGTITVFDDDEHKKILAEDYVASNHWKELKQRIMDEYVTPEYIYDHVWQDGDIFYMDQVTCMHRRTDMNYDVAGLDMDALEERLLNRLEVQV